MNALLSLCIVVLGAAPAYAQTSAIITGIVSDASGGTLPGVALALRNTGTGLTRAATSTTDGRFVFAGIPAGDYELRAELSGFRTAVRQRLAVTVAESLSVPLVMELGGLEQTVTVSGGASSVNTATSSRSTGDVHVKPVTVNGGYGADVHLSSLGGGWDQLVPYSVGNRAFIFLYNRGNGNAKLHEIDATGGLMAPRLAAMGGNWDTIVPYAVGGKTYHLWYSRSAGSMRIYPILADGSYGPVAHTGNPGGGWDRIVPYTVAGKGFLLWYSNGNGRAVVYPIMQDGGYGANVQDAIAGSGLDISSYTTTAGTFLLFSDSQVLKIHTVASTGKYL